MTAPEERKALIGLISEATLAGARQAHACNILGLSARTVQRWQCGEPDVVDGRTLRHHEPRHKLSADERAELLAVANSPEFGHLPSSQIVPRLADQQRYIASESTSTGYSRPRSNSPTGAANGRRAHAANPVRFAPTRRTSCIAGTSRTCRRRSVESIFICICCWMCSAGRLSAGRSMPRKTACWPAKSSGTYARAKRYSPTS